MSDGTSQEATPPPLPPAAAAAVAESSFTPSWKLPDGIEDHLESGLVKAAVGMTLGGIAGMMLFRPGGGYRAASIATGLGIAFGSTYQRAKETSY
mmetsp:Transcript_1363/g.1835  ORF Transcript_1363/g.1835 Transcript_1363/m.1835 type:complete len:95 (+) Transcript_1363:179-463(+)|eukprot:CAMPEP_0198145042 /NCGR_PEP_ID=MMETSP1443-20131203/20616_1 /TAXON_ID=186043 /ORGANISM="Entomoneis sp., Strain CCMP2396" /LENGTH=94 /DNA_ID=CAMNT_0043808557 /DNA_START=121 /DNA_END=405 /DNA_ORIENTATION=+